MLTSFLLLAAEAAAEVPAAVDGGWAAWLKEYGGWAISVVLAGVVVYMARYIVTKLEAKPPNAEQSRVIRESEQLRGKQLYDEVYKDVLAAVTETITPLVTSIEKNTGDHKQVRKDMQTGLAATLTPLIAAIKDNTGDHEQVRKDLLDAIHDHLAPLITAIEASTSASVEMKAALEVFFTETSKEKNAIITELARQKDEVGKEAMSKMEASYAQVQGIFEKVIGAAMTLKATNDRLLAIEAKKQAEA